MIILPFLLLFVHVKCYGLLLRQQRLFWKQVFPGFPAMLGKSGESCIPENLKTETIPEISKQEGEPVYLKVYDLFIKPNRLTDGLGFGFYHSGVQVYDTEYAYSTEGITANGTVNSETTEIPIKVASLIQELEFKESFLLGYTKLNQTEVERHILQLNSTDYTGDKYNLITHNCNHFADTFVTILTGSGIPSWVNRLAYFFECVQFQRLIPQSWISQ